MVKKDAKKCTYCTKVPTTTHHCTLDLNESLTQFKQTLVHTYTMRVKKSINEPLELKFPQNSKQTPAINAYKPPVNREGSQTNLKLKLKEPLKEKLELKGQENKMIMI